MAKRIGTCIRSTAFCHFQWSWATFEWQQNVRRHGASRGLSVTAELLVKLTIIINRHFTSASSSLNFCSKIIHNVLVRHYYWLDVIYQVCFWNVSVMFVIQKHTEQRATFDILGAMASLPPLNLSMTTTLMVEWIYWRCRNHGLGCECMYRRDVGVDILLTTAPRWASYVNAASNCSLKQHAPASHFRLLLAAAAIRSSAWRAD